MDAGCGGALRYCALMQEESTPDVAGAAEPPATLELTHDQAGGAVVRLTGELDLSSIALLEPQIARVLDPPPTHLTVDVSDVRFADSSAITLWVRWSGAVDQFELRGASPLLRMVIERMGLAPRFGLT
jgi:anti-anti-sigma factor